MLAWTKLDWKKLLHEGREVVTLMLKKTTKKQKNVSGTNPAKMNFHQFFMTV